MDAGKMVKRPNEIHVGEMRWVKERERERLEEEKKRRKNGDHRP